MDTIPSADNQNTTSIISKKNEQGQAESHNEMAPQTDTIVDSLYDKMSHQLNHTLLTPLRTRKTNGGYGIALVSILIAFLVRWAVDWYLGDTFQFATFLIAVIVTAWYGGPGSSFLSMALGALIWNWFFAQPRYHLSLAGLIDQAGMIIYFTISLTTIGFLQTWKWAWNKTERMTRELQQRMANTNTSKDR